MSENDNPYDPGIPDFAGDYDGFAADSDLLDRFPVQRAVQAGGRVVSAPR
jgi:hypothetical protein